MQLAVNDLKVLDSIIQFVSIDMMDVFGRIQLSPDMLFHNDTMFEKWTNNPIGASNSDLLVVDKFILDVIGRITGVTAKNPPSASYLTRGSLNNSTAVAAGGNNFSGSSPGILTGGATEISSLSNFSDRSTENLFTCLLYTSRCV